MKNIAKYSVNKPISILMGMLIVIILGIVSIMELPLELFPDINLPYAVVVTTYEGKNAFEVEEDVTKPIEQNLMSVSNLKQLQSTSREHFSIVIAEFEQSTNMDTAFLEMREKFDLLRLKEGVNKPMIIKFDPDMMPLMVVSMSRDWGDVSDETALIQTTEWINDDVLNKLERIPGVASVNINGGSDTVIQLDFNDDQLKAYHLTKDDVLRVIKDQNIDGLAGIVPDGKGIRMLYIGDKIVGIENLKTTPILFNTDLNKVITLADLTDNIGFVNAAENQYNKINGKQGITISFQKQSGVGITEVVESIQKTLNEITGSTEYDAEYVEILNQGEYINQSIGSITSNLIIGGVLAVLILFIFLRDIRPTLIVGLSIPISVIGSFVLMFAFGVSLNIISMGGLALGIGMLVDNSIVVIENIYRLLQEGKTRKEATIYGAGQVAGAITSSTITTIAVFLPIVFTEGLVAELFTAMALTVTFSLVASLVIAITMVPSLSANLLKQNGFKEDKIIKFLQSLYEGTVRFALKRKLVTLFLILVLLVLSGFLANRNGFVMLPTTDEGTITINVEMKKGTTFNQTAALTDLLVEKIRTIEEVETISASIGGSGMRAMFGMGGSTDSSSITILLKDDREATTLDIVKEIETIRDTLDYQTLELVKESDVYEISVDAQNTATMGGFGGTGVQLIVKGEDIYKMRDLSDKLVTILESVEGTKDLDNGISQTDDVIRILVNKENAMEKGLTEADIKNALSIFYTSLGFDLTQTTNTKLVVQVKGTDYELSVPSSGFGNITMTYDVFLSQVRVFNYQLTNAIQNKLAEKDQNFNLYIMNIPFVNPEQTIPNPLFDPSKPMGALLINPLVRYNATTNQVYTVAMSDVLTDTNPTVASLTQASIYEGNTENSIANVIKDAGFGSISRDGKSRFMTVSAQIETGYKINEVASQVEQKVNEYLNSDEFKTQYQNYGYTVEIAGENEDIQQTTNDLILVAIIAILLVYMVMAIQFQSLKYPFIVMFTIPLAFTGGLFGLYFSGLPISMVAMIGFVILSGIVVNNGIVLIDYINQLREEGMSVDDAIIIAGKTRLRPILMTALTTILALIPMAIGLGEGAELLQPLGVTSIGGLIYATILTLIVIPIMYSLLNRKNRETKKD